ncbi:MAG: Fic family protein [Actinomycetaceae bacterium]|nr:Fic family protein [Actinomycetaceae bacterium]
MSEKPIFRSWDDYFIPGTNVLRNKFVTPDMPFGVNNQERLTKMEEEATAYRFEELALHPIPGNFDYAHMKAIHHRLFQDVYEWAGQERTAPVGTYMVKTAPDVINYPLGDPRAPLREYAYYPAGSELTRAAEAQYTKIAEHNYLRGLDKHTFSQHLGEIWGELNVVHSFREGNTRSQFAFFTQLATQAGWKIDPKHFLPGTPGRDEFVAARFHCQATGTSTRLANLIEKEITPLLTPHHKRYESHAERIASKRLKAMKLDPERVRRLDERLRGGEPPTRGLSC